VRILGCSTMSWQLEVGTGSDSCNVHREVAQVDLELLTTIKTVTATEGAGIEWVQRRLVRIREFAKSLSQSAAAPLAPGDRSLVAADVRHGFPSNWRRRREAGKPSAADSGSSRPRRCLDERFSPLVLSHLRLACCVCSLASQYANSQPVSVHPATFEGDDKPEGATTLLTNPEVSTEA